MGFLADKTVFSPLTKEILEESISFSCGNEDLDGFFHNDAVSYAENLFGKSYCYYLEESKADIVCAFTVSNASVFDQNALMERSRLLYEIVKVIWEVS